MRHADQCGQELADEEFFYRLAVRLTSQREIPATAEYTGGDIWNLHIPEPLRPGTVWSFSNQSDVWYGVLKAHGVEVEGDQDHTEIDTELASDETSDAIVAHAIETALEAWRRTYGLEGDE